MKENNETSMQRTLSIVYIGVCVALMAVCSWISIPATVPFTLQTFAVNLALILLGGKKGTLATLVYLLVGLIGVPVFAGFSGGPGVLFGPTGGYLIGFLAMGLIYWGVTKLLGVKLWTIILSMVLGTVVLYAFGTAWFIVVYGMNNGAVTLAEALAWCVTPFIPSGIAKSVLAIVIGRVLTTKTSLFTEIAR
ncbi:MAG: biotin transporter BioY [Lachnospiraceae bacterium]|nr:biotin transporter BioY [Lachnospiraceae bacterium]